MAGSEQPAGPRASVIRGGYRLMRVSGIEIVADWSLVIIFALVFFALGASAFPALHPDWSPWLVWTTAAVAALGLFASIALHELSHAWVANRNGMRVSRITLFIFGGVAHLEGRPKSPKVELRVAGVGPLMSIAIGAILTLAGIALARRELTGMEPRTAMAALSPLATVLLWLGPVNLLLAAFNLLPGFPLDGGRVLRAGLWSLTGDVRRATRWASLAGQLLAWMLMLGGVSMMLGVQLPFFGRGAFSGLWLLLIGWFLNNAAQQGYRQLVIDQALRDVRVRDVVRPRREERVYPSQTLDAVAEGVGLTSATTVLPVVEGERLVGMVDLESLRRVPRTQWGDHTVSELMVPLAELEVLDPDTPATDALTALTRQDPIPVTERGDRRLVGMLRASDLARWLAFHSDTPGNREVRGSI